MIAVVEREDIRKTEKAQEENSMHVSGGPCSGRQLPRSALLGVPRVRGGTPVMDTSGAETGWQTETLTQRECGQLLQLYFESIRLLYSS